MTLKWLPAVKLIYATSGAERIVASAAKATLSPRDFTEISSGMEDEDVEKWIRELVTRGHGSPLEHCLYVYEIVCSRVTSHQLVRHRHASYSQLSQRYSDKYLRGLVERASKLLGLERPSDYGQVAQVLRKLAERGLNFTELLDALSEAFIIPPAVVVARNFKFLVHLIESVASYYEALSSGVPYEDARYLLPQAVKTRLIVSMNAREILEVFLPLRMCSRAQWEIRHIAWELWRQLVRTHPSIFRYAGPRCVLIENRIKSAPCNLDDYLSGKCDFTMERCPEGQPRARIHKCLSDSLPFKDWKVDSNKTGET